MHIKNPLNVSELSLVFGLHPMVATFSVHHPPAQGHTWDLGLRMNVPKLNAAESSFLVDCFLMCPPVMKHFPGSLLVASLHIYKHCVLLIFDPLHLSSCVPVLISNIVHLCVFLFFL